MKTQHRIVFGDARQMAGIHDGSIHLVVTSPPYPMIEMWDALFEQLNPKTFLDLSRGRAEAAFEGMHLELDRVWAELWRGLVPGGIACINIGDATRTVKDRFALYVNHARILNRMLSLGFSALPAVLWRKPTNAPNKFMGSGMMPPGAYVTLEHEYILILRKGDKRIFKSAAEKHLRQESAFFWEERNNWFSDVWFGLIGTQQKLMDKDLRKRSAAYPFELAYRLISMFSMKGDTVLDPFLGTGTTTSAALAAGRNSVGIELDANFGAVIAERILETPDLANRRIDERIKAHLQFVEERIQENKRPGHENVPYGFPVITRQEMMLFINPVQSCQRIAEDRFEALYTEEYPTAKAMPASSLTSSEPKTVKPKGKKPGETEYAVGKQMNLLDD